MGKEERALRRAERKAKRLRKYPDTDGVPPWVLAARERVADAAKVLARAAIEAVKMAAKEAISGALKSNQAAAAVMLATGVDEDAAIDAVFDAFERMERDND
jgi:hypothetical protein